MSGTITKLTILYIVLQIIDYGDSALHKVSKRGDLNYDESAVNTAFENEFPQNLSELAGGDEVVKTAKGDIRKVTTESRDQIAEKLQLYRLKDKAGPTYRDDIEGNYVTEGEGQYVVKTISGTNIRKEFWQTQKIRYTKKIHHNIDLEVDPCYITPSERATRQGVPLIFIDGPNGTVEWTAFGDENDSFDFI